MLRLVDYCLGSDGEDIWQDKEFKNVNQDVYDYLHGTIPVIISLEISAANGLEHTLQRGFSDNKKSKPLFQLDEVHCKNLTSYRQLVKKILFGSESDKPTLRQLAPKFVRSSHELMSKTLKFHGDYTSDVDYEAIHLFLFGFFAVDVLEERPRLTRQLKKLSRDLEALTRVRKEGEIEQLLIHLRREVDEISQSNKLKGEIPEIASHADVVAKIRGDASNIAGMLGGYEGEVSSITMAIAELDGDFEGIDMHMVEAIYKDANKYIPELQHSWEETSAFVQSLRGRKKRFLQSQAESLQKKIEDAKEKLEKLQVRETEEIKTITHSREFAEALELRADLQQKLKQLGSYEQDLQDIRDLKKSIDSTQKKLDATKELIDQGNVLLQKRIAIFNEFFSSISKDLYGEQYLLHSSETSKGTLSFRLSAVGSNVGSGKKASQTAAFDLAYIKFLNKTGIHFPQFVCHDGMENIHGNQLLSLFEYAIGLEGQLVLSTLRDKLPHDLDAKVIAQNTIIELSPDDKLFRLK
ncbi:MAG: DUF2326 domain-containing protein [Alphaproteobacteria bacterium]|nr:DUF2326 domain-containing protein [Alphaproteobacteria bacterium]